MLLVAKLIKSAAVYIAVGVAKLNVGGAASAPAVAAAFHPAKRPFGVLLPAVFGYAIGTS